MTVGVTLNPNRHVERNEVKLDEVLRSETEKRTSHKRSKRAEYKLFYQKIAVIGQKRLWGVWV